MTLAARTLRLAARPSPLSRRQAEEAARRLAGADPGLRVEFLWVSTLGDQDQETTPPDLGATGVFEKEVDRAVAEGRAEASVHSLKDLPLGRLPGGLALLGVLPRGPVEDALVSTVPGVSWSSLPDGARVGTSSLRRQAMVRFLSPNSVVGPVRGNVGTRLEKLRRGEFDALVLAESGLVRLGVDPPRLRLSPLDLPPAPGQGFLAIVGGPEMAVELGPALRPFALALMEAQAERAFLQAVGGGCSATVGAHARAQAPDRGEMAVVEWRPDGSARRRWSGSGPLQGLGPRAYQGLQQAPWEPRQEGP
jgi:hydroxymethylbilane synthase